MIIFLKTVHPFLRKDGLFMRQYKTLAVFMLFMTFAFFLDSFSEFFATCDNIRDKVLRLHIIAASDTDSDQSVKLKIRDRILKESDELFYTDKGILSAKEKALGNLEKIEKLANDELLNNGLKPTAKAEFTNMFFDTRVYDNFTLPAGNYDAVRVIIGEGKGKNWWCVLYPALCIPAASDGLDTLTDEEIKIIEAAPRYEVKFLLVELIEKFKSFC